jgi:pimeloyl-ACP methyl ester carboxylesterase
MKCFRSFATLSLVFAGTVLPACAAAATATAPAFTPTRFLITDRGTAGKPDVILIPGLGCSFAVWDDEVKLLAPNYQLHLVQIDGFAGVPPRGNTVMPILPGVVEELHSYIAANKMHPVVIGHSIGGLLALMLADRYPEDVRKLVLVDTLPFSAVMFSPAATVASTKEPANILRKNLLLRPDDSFTQMETVTISGMVKDETARKVLLASMVASDRGILANAMYEDLQTDLRGDIATIKTPALMLYPFDPAMEGPDPATTDALYTSAYKTMPNVKLLRIDDSRHFIMYDQPAKLDAAIEPFLQ